MKVVHIDMSAESASNDFRPEVLCTFGGTRDRCTVGPNTWQLVYASPGAVSDFADFGDGTFGMTWTTVVDRHYSLVPGIGPECLPGGIAD